MLGLYYQPPAYQKHLIPGADGKPQGFATTTGKVELASEFLPQVGGARLPEPGGHLSLCSPELIARVEAEGGAHLRMITGSALGRAPEGVKRGDVPALALVPEVVLLALVVLLGVALPGPLAGSIEEASAIVMSYEEEGLSSGSLFEDALAALAFDDTPEEVFE